MKFKWGSFLTAIVIVGGLVIWGNWDKFGSYPTWEVTERDDASGLYHLMELKINGRGYGQYTPTLTIRCENRVLSVSMFIGIVERIGGGTGAASIQVAEYFVPTVKGTISGIVHFWSVPADSVTLVRDEPADFVRQLAAQPWFMANASGSSSFHVETIVAHLPNLEQRCDLMP